MINDVFNFLFSAFVIFILAEVASLIFVSVHDTFSRKRSQLRKYYKDRRKPEDNK